MNSSDKKPPAKEGLEGKAPPARASEKPGWADGLRQLYDSVVEEEIPDSFKDLLSKLDEKD